MTALTSPRKRPQGGGGPLVGFGGVPASLPEAIQLAEILARSCLVPKDYQAHPENILLAMQYGAELGFRPMQSLTSLAVINGRPCLYGDALMAVVRGSGLCEYIKESDDGQVATCRVKRVGEEEAARSFSMEDAQRAGLPERNGVWRTYPARMRQMRARAFALRDVFADLLRGMASAEEVADIAAGDAGPLHMGTAQVVREEAAPSGKPPTQRVVVSGAAQTSPVNGESGAQQVPQLPPYPQARFEAKLPAWRDLVDSGKHTPESILRLMGSKALLSNSQKAAILALGEATSETSETPEAAAA